LLDAASGQLPLRSPEWLPGVSVCVVLAAEGYPGKVRNGDAITGLGPDGQLADTDTVVFHAGTKRDGKNLVTAGGRVLGVTAVGSNLDEARSHAYAGVDRIAWPGMHFRKDIGLRGKS
jgi:phosphoribosylamine--glycine ligase